MSYLHSKYVNLCVKVSTCLFAKNGDLVPREVFCCTNAASMQLVDHVDWGQECLVFVKSENDWTPLKEIITSLVLLL
jgi:hypothetical protein